MEINFQRETFTVGQLQMEFSGNQCEKLLLACPC